VNDLTGEEVERAAISLDTDGTVATLLDN
jgi:molybdopterin/thiamine biosynthesis adenylyltransferase